MRMIDNLANFKCDVWFKSGFYLYRVVLFNNDGIVVNQSIDQINIIGTMQIRWLTLKSSHYDAVMVRNNLMSDTMEELKHLFLYSRL